MRPVFCGNFDYDTRHSELERLFSRYGPVERIDMKSGYAFVYFEDERDAEDAIRGLDNIPFGYSRRRLSVEWSRQGERGGPRNRSMANMKPTKTLFVINFDPIRTRVRDIERHFEPYGNILHVRIRRNFAFVQFESQEEATKALECTNMTISETNLGLLPIPMETKLKLVIQFLGKRKSDRLIGEGASYKILDRVVSVEYALRDDDERDDRRDSPRRGGGGGYGRRESPDYGRRASPDYGRRPSPAYGRRPSPDYSHEASPGYDRYNGPARGPAYDRDRSPDYGRHRSRSPVRRSRT